jgi:heme A synthase
MNTRRPVVVTIAAILLLILSLFVAGLGIARQYGLLQPGFGNQQFLPGQFLNRNFNPQGRIPQGDFPQGSFPQGGFPNDQNNQGVPQNFAPNQQIGVGMVRIFRLIRPLSIAFDVILIVLGVVAAIGLFKNRRWGATLAIVLASLLFLTAIPGLLRFFSPVGLIENIVRMLLAVAIIILLLLPTARNSYLPVKEYQRQVV